jgi:FkbM family methyltransferase
MLNGLWQITVLPLALGAAGALRPLEVDTARGMADSTLRTGGGGKEQVESSRERILAAGLDWLWPQMCGAIDQIDGVKVDVQGMELEVLRGMTSLLGKWKPKLVVEVHSGVERGALLGVIEAAGYVRAGIPIEPVQGEIEPQYVDNHSYAFAADGQAARRP